MRKVLIPIDGSDRSIKSVEVAKSLFKPGDVYIKLFLVREDLLGPLPDGSLEPPAGMAKKCLEEADAMLEGYDHEISIVFGRAGEQILETAKDDVVDMIVMTKSTKKGWVQAIGSVTSYVVKYAPCVVMIAPEI